MHGRNPYTHATTLNAQGTPESRYIYPPLVAGLLAPIAPLPFLAAAVVFLLVSTQRPLALAARRRRRLGWFRIPSSRHRRGATRASSDRVLALPGFRAREQPRRRAGRRREDLHVAAARVAGRAANPTDLPSLAAALIAFTFVPWALIGFAGLTGYPRLLNDEAASGIGGTR